MLLVGFVEYQKKSILKHFLFMNCHVKERGVIDCEDETSILSDYNYLMRRTVDRPYSIICQYFSNKFCKYGRFK